MEFHLKRQFYHSSLNTCEKHIINMDGRVEESQRILQENKNSNAITSVRTILFKKDNREENGN